MLITVSQLTFSFHLLIYFLGKTTLVDKLLEHCGNKLTFERAMDSNEHEKERGITIMSKYTRLLYNNHMLHVVDTPGHADFGGEVERILSMVDGVVLLVDATEGPMAQTKFVLSKAIEANKKAIVVLNKVDRDSHRSDEVELEIFELFCSLTSRDELLHYPLLYASGRQGWVTRSLADTPGKQGVIPLLDAIIEHIPPPINAGKLNQQFTMSVNTIQTDYHLGRIVTGKVESGSIKLGDKIKVLSREGKLLFPDSKVTKLFYLEGLKRVDVDATYAGEIISLAGCNGGVTDTICDPSVTDPIKTVPISPPIISMTFGPNDSPLAGREGTKFTSSMIKDRLQREVENNVTLQLRPSSETECIDVQGRGELQIGILVETLRREGFELTVSPPRVLPQIGEDGIEREPIEEVIVDIDPELQGIITDSMAKRKGNMLEFKEFGNRSRLIFHVPSRGMMGFRHEIITATRGNATVNSLFSHYDVVKKSDFNSLKKYKLISMETGKTTGYALDMVQERGILYIHVGEEVYEGMIIGENAKTGGDIEVNPCRMKRLTNMRSTGSEEKVNLSPPKRMTVEEVMAYLDDDEVIEVTPKNIRLRKRILDTGERVRFNKSMKPVTQR
jgi:GTP-binding protein